MNDNLAEPPGRKEPSPVGIQEKDSLIHLGKKALLVKDVV